MSKDIKIYFVLPSTCEDELSTSEPMQQAFELCRQNQMIPDWIRESDCISTQFAKKDVVVFEKFEGEAFKKLQSMRCLSLAGPWCIITCLLEGIPVPNNKSPVYTMAMNKLCVTASNFSPDHKRKLKEKVDMMGGTFNLNITSSVTHLITNSVKTQKYMVANECNIKVMLDTWVEEVWKASMQRNVKAADEEFVKYKCPIFKNLQVSCTGLTMEERNKLQKVLTEHGGIYSGKLIVGSTNALICNPGVHSDKFTVALKYNIPCVTKAWVYDSLERGYTIPEEKYVIKMSSSTPTKHTAPLNPDFSMMSAIGASESTDQLRISASSISDTVNISLFNLTSQNKQGKEPLKENKVPDLIDEIDLKQVKQAGTFLDGCGVYLTGFSPNRREKLCRILKSAGATRYDDITDRVTQILVGDPTSHETRLLSSKGCIPPMVSTKWLVECIKQRQPVYEEPFTVETNNKAPVQPSSPLSKKGLTLLQHDTSVMEPVVPKIVEPEANKDETETMLKYMQQYTTNKPDEDDTLAQLLAHGNIDSKINSVVGDDDKPPRSRSLKPADKPPATTNITAEQTSSVQEESLYPILEGKTFKLLGYTDDEFEKVCTIVEEMRGKVMPNTYKGITDYAVTPTICRQVRHTATEIVSDLWVLDCHTKNQLLDVEYYHQPFYVTYDDKPLENCVVTLSGYTSYERTYLMVLLEYLGALYQDKFARITLADRSVQASTHLVCMEPSGSKYCAALRWNRPVVSHKWLLQCAERGVRADEKLYQLEQQAPDKSTPVESASKYSATVETPQWCNKRDFDGRKVSPVAAANEEPQPSTSAGRYEAEASEKKFKFVKDRTETSAKVRESVSPFAGFPNCTIPNANTPVAQTSRVPPSKPSSTEAGDPVITLEDGTKVLLSNFMLELRNQGLFDTPSPAQKLETGTPFAEIINRLKRDGILPSGKDATPKRSLAGEFGDTELGGSQGTPVGKYIRDLQERKVLPSTPKHRNTPDSPLPRPYFDVATPDTPLGQFLEENPSRETRKHFQRCIDRFRDNEPAVSQPDRRLSTPWSEVKKQAWNWLLRDKNPEGSNNNVVKKLSDQLDDKDKEAQEENNTRLTTTTTAAAAAAAAAADDEEPQAKADERKEEETDTQIEVSCHIGHLQNMLSRRESTSGLRASLLANAERSTPQKYIDLPTKSSSSTKDSQQDYVEWEEPMEGVEHTTAEDTTEFRYRKFMLSSLEQSMRNSCCTAIKSLGGEVSELNHYDPSATHVVCSNPTRNEKILSSMAAGKWIVHVSYIQASGETGKFVDEELYEFGNPKSAPNLAKIVDNTPIIESMHWWRMRVLEQSHGAFHGMRALVFSKNKPALIRLIEAGQGVIVHASPPYSHSVDATHCFVDPKLRMDQSDFIPLAEQGIPCLNVLFLSNHLNTRTSVQIKDFLLPELQSYYS